MNNAASGGIIGWKIYGLRDRWKEGEKGVGIAVTGM